MIRLTVRTDDAGFAANVGGAVESTYKSFDIDAPEIEAYLRELARKKWLYTQRQVIAYEVLGEEPEPAKEVTLP